VIRSLNAAGSQQNLLHLSAGIVLRVWQRRACPTTQQRIASGFVKDWSWDDEGRPPLLSLSQCLCRSSVPKREASEMASRMDHAFQ
jgi:hypothetical protein